MGPTRDDRQKPELSMSSKDPQYGSTCAAAALYAVALAVNLEGQLANLDLAQLWDATNGYFVINATLFEIINLI